MRRNSGVRIRVSLVAGPLLVGVLVVGGSVPAFALGPGPGGAGGPGLAPAAGPAAGPGPAPAGGPGHHGGPGGGGGGGGSVGGSTTTGFDVSYPQCGTALPSPTAFGIVGVNGGLANDLNSCLGPSSSYPNYTQSELYWAVAASVGGTSQPKTSLYVNTADPGNMYDGKPIGDWPTTSISTDPYGICKTVTVTSRGHSYTVGENSNACAWQYGYNKAAQDVVWLSSAASAINSQESSFPVPATAASYPWWLDVETANTWQSDTAMNAADLQGMVAAFEAAGVVTVGAYSTSSQWDSITGGTDTSSAGSLFGMPDWIPGATSETQAMSNCSLPAFTGGSVTVTQWTGTIDNDYPC